MGWKSESTGERRRLSGLRQVCAAGALGLVSAWLVHTSTHDTSAAGEGMPQPPCPVTVASRYLDLGTRWEHELVTASFAITNTSDQPVVLVSGATSCSSLAAFAASGNGPEIEFTESRRVTVGAFDRCVIGARFTVRGAGERERLEIGCLVVAGPRSWPLRFTIDYRGEAAVVVDPAVLRLDAGERLGEAVLRLIDGGAFAVVAHQPRSGWRAFTQPATPACLEWSVGVMVGQHLPLHDAHVLELDLVTPSRRQLRLHLPLQLAH